MNRSCWQMAVQVGFVAVAVLPRSCGPHAVLGQTGSQAEIIGIVTDESGAVLPANHVATATSPALQVGQLLVVTDARGSIASAGFQSGPTESATGSPVFNR